MTKRSSEIEDKRHGWLASIKAGWIVVVARRNILRKDLGFSAKVERITPSGQIIVGNPGKPKIKFMPDGFNESYTIHPYNATWQDEKTKSNQLYYIKQWLKDEDFMSQLPAETISKIYELLKEKEKERDSGD
ncbi:hypothetical protein [Streptococcus suis]|uniref:hypothetical protein n=1 Tax=Streptococcus suis TaxID=1307 RepID=UPI0038BDC0F2